MSTETCRSGGAAEHRRQRAGRAAGRRPADSNTAFRTAARAAPSTKPARFASAPFAREQTPSCSPARTSPTRPACKSFGRRCARSAATPCPTSPRRLPPRSAGGRAPTSTSTTPPTPAKLSAMFSRRCLLCARPDRRATSCRATRRASWKLAGAQKIETRAGGREKKAREMDYLVKLTKEVRQNKQFQSQVLKTADFSDEERFNLHDKINSSIVKLPIEEIESMTESYSDVYYQHRFLESLNLAFL